MRVDVYNKVTPKSEQETVYVVNKSMSETFTDMFNGIKYILKPRTRIPVPKFVAKHWLGDPDYLGEREEIVRLQQRLGAQFSLLESGDVFSPSFGDQTSAYRRTRPSKIIAEQHGTPLDEEDDFLQELLTQPVANDRRRLAAAMFEAGAVPAHSIEEAAEFIVGNGDAE